LENDKIAQFDFNLKKNGIELNKNNKYRYQIEI